MEPILRLDGVTKAFGGVVAADHVSLAVMPGQVPRAEKHRRSARMIALAAQGRAAFLQRQVGLVEPVLFESRLADGLWEGYTANYTPVRAAGAENLQGRLLPVRVTAAGDDWCLGELL